MTGAPRPPRRPSSRNGQTYPHQSGGDSLTQSPHGRRTLSRCACAAGGWLIGALLVCAPALAAAPGAPTNLTARATGPRTIELSWTAPADGGKAIIAYTVERSTDGVDWSVVQADTGSAQTTWRDEGLRPASLHYYRVSAINIDGTGAASAAASAQTRGAAWISQAPASVAEGEEIVIEVTQTRGSRPIPYYRSRGLVWISDTGGVLGRVELDRSAEGGYWMRFDGNHGTVRLPTRANGRIGEGGTVTLTLFSTTDSFAAGFRRIEPYTATVAV